MTITEPGDLVIEWWANEMPPPDGNLRIRRADPVILVAAEVVDGMRSGDYQLSRGVHFESNVLTIDAINQRVVYRIGEYIPEQRAYRAEWPD